MVTLWQLLYLWTSVFVKASICATLVRISVRRTHTVLLGGLVAVSVVGSLATSLVLTLRCRPLAASWDPARGACHNPELVVVFTYLMSAVNIVTDTAVALVPIHLLWDVQMPPRVKMLSWLILGIGVLYVASFPPSFSPSSPCLLSRDTPAREPSSERRY